MMVETLFFTIFTSFTNFSHLKGYECIFSFNLNMQLPVTLQNGNEVNREMLPPQTASSVCDSTKHNGLVTQGCQSCCNCFVFQESKKKSRKRKKSSKKKKKPKKKSKKEESSDEDHSSETEEQTDSSVKDAINFFIAKKTQVVQRKDPVLQVSFKPSMREFAFKVCIHRQSPVKTPGLKT